MSDTSPVKIYYNGSNPFSGLAPTPVVGRGVAMRNYNARWGEEESYSLVGEITGACNDFEDIVTKQETLIERFAEDFHSFQIIEDEQTILDRPYAIIDSISFESSKYVDLLPFVVNLRCYSEGGFSGVFGVLDPSDEFSFSEDTDGKVNLRRSISARGFNTDQLALENAKEYVLSRTGWQDQVFPAFINACYGIEPCLTEFGERINRLEGTYSVDETYQFDTEESGKGILRYTVDVNSGINEGVNEVSMNGSIEGCGEIGIDEAIVSSAGTSGANGVYIRSGNAGGRPRYVLPGTNWRIQFDFVEWGLAEFPGIFGYIGIEPTDFPWEVSSWIVADGDAPVPAVNQSKESQPRNRYKNLDIFSRAFDIYTQVTNLSGLNPYPISSGVEEDIFANTISFQSTFDDDPSPLTWVDHQTTIDEDIVEGGLTASLRATIQSRGPLKDRWLRVREYYSGVFNGYSLANQDYLDAGYSGSLRYIPTNESVSYDERQAEISYNATWDNLTGIPSGLKTLEYTIGITPPIDQFFLQASLMQNGYYTVQDMNTKNREEITVQGTALVTLDTPMESGILIVKNYLNGVRSRYVGGSWAQNRLVLDQDNLTTGQAGDRSIRFGVNWSRDNNKIAF